MTLFCLLSCGFTVVLLDLDEDLDVVFLLGLYGVCVLDLLWSHHWSGLISFYVMKISCVVCHSSNDGAGVMVSGSASVGASVMWLGTTFVWTIKTVTSISTRVWLQSWPAVPVPVPVVVSGGWSGMMPCVPSPVACRCAWWWYSICTICCYVTILNALKTMHIRAIMCNVAQFLTLKTLISLIGCHINCTRG